ncbi:Coxiella burnetii protein of unknown function (DUF807) (plasmid) [Candidatus Rhabdochlamydia oedothoracis]|uniref:Uncharacterized protein n=1 Tax=Candidatus Rhabdochlamydia oedothoracis TaxID=2720720 RepID=A0ABX8V8G2_9BACT|nr:MULTISPECIES: DUF807 family protein [Rhabdochlamydia]KAG6558726.1 hypothetical protein RHOW815_001279 [Candidatus Rhabdochlamydia sp. W815]QYF49494.1 Coxiella burnetii protein of unknown function (DUF807) [Candidatus Rhabdochlamydia oedothoracis]
MLNVYFAFEGPTAKVLSYFGNTEKAIENLSVNRTAAGKYTCVFLTGRRVNQNQQPIVQGTSNGRTETVGICNIIRTNIVFFPNYGAYPYQITIDIESYGGAADPDIIMVAYSQSECI